MEAVQNVVRKQEDFKEEDDNEEEEEDEDEENEEEEEEEAQEQRPKEEAKGRVGIGSSDVGRVHRLPPGDKSIVFGGPQNERQEAVVDAFKHAWKGYKKFAWGHDHLR